jgi:heme-degrading monooxygenase HmoA
MIQLQPLDAAVPIQAQLGEDVAPVILVNMFRFAPEDEAAVVKAWEHDANWMKQQPGYISTQLHRAVGQSAMFMNYAVWESVAHFQAAFSNPEFHAALGAYPDSTIASPHLFERIAVPNLCTE